MGCQGTGRSFSRGEKYMYTKNAGGKRRWGEREREISVIPRCARVGSRRQRERRNSGGVGTDDDDDDNGGGGERLGIEFASRIYPRKTSRHLLPAPSTCGEKGPHSAPHDNLFCQTAAGKSPGQQSFITGARVRAHDRFIASD